MSSGGKSQITVVDSRPVVRRGLKAILGAAEDLVVCCEAESINDQACAATQACTDVAIVGNNAASLRGLRTVSYLRGIWPDTPIIVVSDQHECIRTALRLGIGAVVSTYDPESDIIKAVRHVLSGKIFVGENELDYLVESEFCTPEECRFGCLTLRETLLVDLLSRGLTLREAAEYLNVTVKTARTYLRKVESKLDAAARRDGLLLRAARLLRDTGRGDALGIGS